MWKLGRTVRAGLVVGAVMAVTAAPVLAASSVQGSLSGFEDAIPTSCGSGCQQAYFAGYFSATPNSDSGFFSATVDHDGLPTASGVTARIVGGTFTLDMLSGKVVSGRGITGSISYGSPSLSFFGCTQTYGISIAPLPVGGTANFTTASASASLTHYGTGESEGSCTGIFFATISGTLTLSR
jgi:hypothetical protein